MKLNKIVMLFAMSTFTLAGFAQTKVIAHRGYWKCEGSAQNSIASLTKAAGAKVYGSEFDVQLTKDNVVVVNHDDDINGVIIGETPYAKLKKMTLKNGETMPTLVDYLKVGKKLPEVQMILEIKPHKTKEAEDEIVRLVVKQVKKLRMKKQVEYISFSMNICEQLAKQTLGSEIAYLGGDASPKELKEKGINGIDYYVKVLNQKPEWIDEAHQLGMKVNVWTVNDMEMVRKMMDRKVDYVTTDNPVEAKTLIEGK